MKKFVRIFVLVVSVVLFQMCAEKPNEKWVSEHSSLELNYSEEWEFIQPMFDTKTRTLVGLTNKQNENSLVVKISDDLPKDEIPDSYYFQSIKKDILSSNSSNKLITEDEIEFKGKPFHRFIYSLESENGELIQNIYTHRSGSKVTDVEFSYPKSMSKDPVKVIPSELEKLLSQMKL